MMPELMTLVGLFQAADQPAGASPYAAPACLSGQYLRLLQCRFFSFHTGSSIE